MTTPIAPSPSTVGGQDPKLAARQIAAAAIASARDNAGVTPPPDPAPTPTPVPDSTVTPVVPTDVTPTPTPPAEPGVTPPVDPAAAVTPADVVELATEAGVSLEEVVETLAGFGVAVETEGIPDDLRGRYGQLLEVVRSAVAPIVEQDDHTKAQLRQLDVFKTRLDENPDSILLSLMIHKPEAFAKVMEIAERAKDDEEYRATVKRGVELEARESQLAAREVNYTQQQLEEKGRRAEVAVGLAVRRYGVDPKVADRMVAGMVEAQGAEFKLSSIDGIVAQLKPKAAVPKPPPMITPEAAAAAASVPTTPVGEAPPVVPGATSGLDSEPTQQHRGGFMRSLIKAAGARVDSVGR